MPPNNSSTATIPQPNLPRRDYDMNANRHKKSGTAQRGLRSLSVAVAFPVALTVLDIVFFGSAAGYRRLQKPFYFPPLWALHLAFLGHAFFSGLSAWLIWAEGGFHRHPKALVVCLGQLMLSLGWYPVVLTAGEIRVGLVLCGAILAIMLGCTRMFRNMNPIAGDLLKPCFVWSVLLAVLNVRLVHYVYY